MQNCLARSQAVFIYDNQRLPQLTFNRSINKNPLFIEIVYFQVVTDIIGQYRLIKIPLFNNIFLSNRIHPIYQILIGRNFMILYIGGGNGVE